MKGRAHVFGNDIDTDGIIPMKYCHIGDPAQLGLHALEGVDEGFASRVRKGDFVVAGENFGCGSSREVAVIALLGAGVAGVIAGSFARIFYRNAINTGLPILEVKGLGGSVETGDEIEVFPGRGLVRVVGSGEEFQAPPLPPLVEAIRKAGGLVEYLKARNWEF